MLIKKTRIIGCLFTSTILTNVILQDVYFEVHLGALKAAILYQFFILLILWLNKDLLAQSIKSLLNIKKSQQSKYKLMIKLVLAFIGFIILRITEYYLTIKY
jgi:formate-dependent nitrite reductase membrane component NrfD